MSAPAPASGIGGSGRRVRPAALLAVVLAMLLAGCAGLPAPPPSVDAAEPPPLVVASSAPTAPTAPAGGGWDAPASAASPAAETSTATATATKNDRIADGATLFRRLAAGLSPPVCIRGEHSRQWRRRYAGSPHAFERQLHAALPLMAWVVEEVEARGLPMEFALIPIVESGYRPEARGPGGPTGLWQMIGSTARHHGVLVRNGYDGRLSPVASTRAALDYLAVLHAEFGDWRATAMAYNAGEGRLRRAFARSGDRRVSGERRLPAGLSPITYAYVAKLHALACLVAQPERHGLTLPVAPFVPLDATEAPPAARSLDAVARAWAIDASALRALNPAYRAGLPMPGRAPRVLLHPRTDGARAADGITAAAASAADPSPRRHRVRSGDTLWQIARRYGTTVAALAAANGLRADRPLRVGKRLTIPD